VYLHGGAARWQYAEELLESLTARWHVFAPDFRGHGMSGHVSGAYRLPDYVGDIAAFLERVVGEPAVVYGHSLGGEVGVMLAARHPRFVRALIVGDAPLSTAHHGTEEPTHRAQNELWQSLAGRPVAEIERAMRDTPSREPGTGRHITLRELVGEDSPWFAHQAMSLHQLDPDMLAAVLAGPEDMLVGYDPHVLLPAIECPVLLLQADARRGNAMRDEEVALAKRLLRKPTHVFMEGIGHPLHGPPGMTPRILAVIEPFVSQL
jgi:pimeloyl-ACP methyl ester carboxylesterase